MTLSSSFPWRGAWLRSAFAVGATAALLFAGETRTWSESDLADFQKGTLKNLSIRSDGLLTVAPLTREIYDTNLPYLWSLARDSKGNLYAGGGSNAAVFRIGADGKGKELASLDGLSVQAVAVDSKDRVYAAVSPDGKIYRIASNGKPEVFYDPKAKYIWALLFDSKDNLYAATGDPGGIVRVSPDGKGSVFFHSDETHVRSLAFDRAGNLIAGTDPGGLVMRISPSGAGFVLYQMPKKEVTAVAVAPDGAIYAAAVGNRQPAAATPPAAMQQVAPVPISQPGTRAPTPQRAAPPAAAMAGIVGGSEVYRIEPDGMPSRVWNHGNDVVYAMTFDASGRAILATGNRGQIYRVETPFLFTTLVDLQTTQITALATAPDGRIFAASGNVGKVYAIGPGLAPSGAIESDVFDAGMFSQWGRVSFDGSLKSGGISVVTRSGNLDQPQDNWSPWSAPVTDLKGARITAPPARFVQWKATLAGNAELESVDVAYLARNVRPQVEEIEITPPNFKFPVPSSSPATAQTLNLPALSRRTPARAAGFTVDTGSTTATPSLALSKGYIGARWLASDANGDSMTYSIEIRGVQETAWKPLKDKLNDKYYSWDSTAFPDGEYRIRVTASDAPSNPPGEALSASLESDRFLIDNTPPEIGGLSATRAGDKLEVRWHAADALNNVTKGEYSLDGGEWTVVSPLGKLSDSLRLEYTLSIDAGPGEHTVAVRSTDDYDNQSTAKTTVK